MRRKAERELDSLESQMELALRSEAGDPLATFPGSVVRPLRRMATFLVANGTLPPRLGLASALREEGVTYTSLALATILAHDMAGTVGLVELNWISPGLARLISSEAEAPEVRSRKRAGSRRGDSRPSLRRPESRGLEKAGLQPHGPEIAGLELRGPAETGDTDVLTSVDGVPGAPLGIAIDAMKGRMAIRPYGGDEGGLAAVLQKQTSLDKALVWTALPNLALLPAGRLPVAGRETFVRGAHLRDIIEQLAEHFDYLLLDIPAIASTSDAILLARLASAILLVIRQGITPRRAVAAAVNDLSTCTILGTVLNRAKVSTPEWIYRLVPGT